MKHIKLARVIQTWFVRLTHSDIRPKRKDAATTIEAINQRNRSDVRHLGWSKKL